VESPSKKIEDIRSAVAWMKTAPAIDAQRIGALGICFGAGYVAEASIQEPLHSFHRHRRGLVAYQRIAVGNAWRR
jgi:dienelactone hydrolase